ncbi:MAG: YmaF family protein [Eubacteriales bacterium]|nr:YmaF family protein [Eubacteriales bacterium]
MHEVVGSTQIEGCCDEAHNHRFATVSGEAIPKGCDDHVHEICFRTDSTDGHCHEFKGKTGGAIDVGDGRHVHFAEAKTDEADGHKHCFRVASLIDDPIGKCKKD